MKNSPPQSPGSCLHGLSMGVLLNSAIIVSLLFVSCKSSVEKKTEYNREISGQQYSVYLMNTGIHTGLIIPVNTFSEEEISALSFFKGYRYLDFGWGDEDYYQKRGGGKFCLGVKAVAIPTSSVMRVQGFNNSPEDVAPWSDFALRFDLNTDSFKRLCEYIDRSFRRDEKRGLIETSRKRDGEIIFFKSVYYYHLFNTCNTWAARGLNHSGLDISSFMIITAEDLYKVARIGGVILKGQ